ncbi:cytochrome P450 [Artomyces pyxidatus]|uniref:Cytochrome P450 n=1 Tax=Artomyces pyxidatus TaxID=48021 RepID=A0ACB8SKX4_9AGAM|nr:cytochrome P450 [Artomyces pyxidatus]
MFDPVSGLKFREHVRETYGNVARFHGIFGDQTLLVSDPTTLTNILTKDRDIFEKPHWLNELFLRSIGPGLVSSTGALHRKQRKMLNPIFSVQRLRTTVPLLHKIANQLKDVLQEKVSDGPQEVDVVDWFGGVAIEMISQNVLGYTFGTFEPDAKRNDLKIAIKEFGRVLHRRPTPVMAKLQVYIRIFPLVSRWPARVLRFGAACLPLPALHDMIRLSDIVEESVESLFQAKKELLARGDVGPANQLRGGPDFISALMIENAEAPDDCKLADSEIKAQMITMVSAGTDTTSISLSRIAQLLSQRQDVQEKLRQELNTAAASSGDELGYEELMGLPYLDAIWRETLRLYPASTFSSRTSQADTTIPFSQPIPGATPAQSSLFVPRGTTIMIDIPGVNCNRNIWGADANAWKPERWLAPLPASVADAQIPGVYSNLMSFSGGGRACIGFKLAELETKVVLSRLVKSIRFLPSKTEIVWKMSGPVVSPFVKGSITNLSTLPLILERV